MSPPEGHCDLRDWLSQQRCRGFLAPGRGRLDARRSPAEVDQAADVRARFESTQVGDGVVGAFGARAPVAGEAVCRRRQQQDLDSGGHGVAILGGALR